MKAMVHVFFRTVNTMEPSYMKDIPLRPHPPLKDGETLSGPQILLRNPLTRFPPFGRVIKAQSMEKKLNNNNKNWALTMIHTGVRITYYHEIQVHYMSIIITEASICSQMKEKRW